MAAGAGLAAGGAASIGTLALLSISGGFSAGAFATIDNPTLADIYTIAATKIATALKDAHAQIPATLYASADANQVPCKQALNSLRANVSEARIRLEEARTDSAKAALQRAAAQQQALKQLVAQVQDLDDPTTFVQRAKITAITISPSEELTGAHVKAITEGKATTTVTLTGSGARFATVLERDMKVSVGGQEVEVKSRVPTETDGE